VFSADVRFEGFTQSDWSRVLTLFKPRATSGKERDPERPQGGVVLVHGEGRLRKLLHTNAGRLRLDDIAKDWPLGAEEVARRHHASWALLIESGSLENVMEGFAAKVRRGDDLTSQAVLFASLLREETEAGRISLYPRRLAGVPVPSAGMVNRSLDAICPGGHAMVVGLFDGGELWTSIVLRRSSAGTFDCVLGPDEIRRDMGLLAGDFRRDYRHLARAVEKKVGKLSLGVFAETRTIQALSVDPTPGAWARAVAIRDVILSPVPAALAIPLGIDAGRAAFSAFRSVTDRAQGLSFMSPLFAAAREALGQAAAAAGLANDPTDFDLLDIVRRLLARDR
jgi:hypothetical protein